MASDTTTTSKAHKQPCTICKVFSANCAQATCGHSYCPSCIKGRYEIVMQQRRNYPPKCCNQRLPTPWLWNYCATKFTISYIDQVYEWAFPPHLRLHCAAASCSTHIPLSSMKDNIAHCPSCAANTCIRCKSLAHGDKQCRRVEMNAMSRPAEKEECKPCPKCGMLVRLPEGRDHIICFCLFEWCFTCSATWGTCKCAKANSPSAPAEGQKPAAQAQKKMLHGGGPVTKQVGEALRGLGSSEEQLQDLATWLEDGYTIEELGLEGEGLERALALQRLLAIM